jgi:acyl-CoA reductase-like NAD-dependent aldehyde dehydrogenase
MPPTEEERASTISARSPLSEALAARVAAASEDAISALHAAKPDRRRVSHAERADAEHDALAQLDEVADTLQGLAAWALSGAAHPRVHDVAHQLKLLASDVAIELRTRLQPHVASDGPLMRYVDALAALRSALADYFSEQLTPRAKSV